MRVPTHENSSEQSMLKIKSEFLKALLSKQKDFKTNYGFDIWASGIVAYMLLVDMKHPFTPAHFKATDIKKDFTILPGLILTQIENRVGEWTTIASGDITETMEFVLFIFGIDATGVKCRRPTASDCLEHPYLAVS